MLPRIKRFETRAEFVLWVEFDDGVRVAYDVKGEWRGRGNWVGNGGGSKGEVKEE